MDKSNRYLFVVRSLTGGGAERVVSVLSSELAERGYDIHIITYARTAHDYPINDQVKIHCMPKAMDNVLGKVLRIRDMRKLIRDIQPDLIVPFVGTVLYVSYIASRPERTPIVRTIRNSPWQEPGTRIDKIFRKMMNRQAAAIMVQNEEQREFFNEKLRDKVFVVPNPIDDTFISTGKTAYSDKVARVITVGRLTGQKNQKLLIRAFSEIAQEFPDTRLDIYGSGAEEKNLRSLIDELCLSKRCFLKGRSDHIIEELCRSDLFVMTSDFEGMPNALMEAMAVGLPCISSDCKTGTKTLIDHGRNGWLFETGNQAELVQCLRQALSEPEVLEKMGRQARADMTKNYTGDKAADRMEALFNRLPDKK